MYSRRRVLESGVAAAIVGGAATSAIAAVPTPSAAVLRKRLGARMLMRGNPDYESMRQLAVFNARKPSRFPNAIVLAESVEDVQNAVRYAKARGWKVGVRSGGHSWTASSVRDNALLISLQNMHEMTIDPTSMTAIISPSTAGNLLNVELQDKHKLMTPSAHGVNVGMGGFMMCGGHGWNSRKWGPGCEQLKAIDVVDAEGDLIHATPDENNDWLWAARGAGPGYFGAAVRYYVQLHANPEVMRSSTYVYDIDALEPVVTWLRDTVDGSPKHLEIIMLGQIIDGKPGIVVVASALGTQQEVDSALDMVDAGLSVAKAKVRQFKQPLQAPWRTELPTDSAPAGYRFAVDGIWTNAPAKELVSYLRDLFTEIPGEKYNIFFQCWGPVQDVPNSAYSVQGSIYISANAVYLDEADDAKADAWSLKTISHLHPIGVGAQMNDENMALDPQRYLSAEASARLEAHRAKYDPEGRFVSFLRKA